AKPTVETLMKAAAGAVRRRRWRMGLLSCASSSVDPTARRRNPGHVARFATPTLRRMATRAFPDGFAWGAATAAHQVEGGNWNSDWWEFEHREGTICAEPSGDACDHWHRWP